MGSGIIGTWWLMGEYALLVLFEAPNGDAAMRGLIANGIQGAVSSVTFLAFGEAEIARIIAGLP